jgi:hypothetical protein
VITGPLYRQRDLPREAATRRPPWLVGAGAGG